MALFDLNNPFDVERFRKKVSEMEQRGGYVEITRKFPQRSTSQNSYLHLLLGYFAQEFGYTLEQVKMQVFKQLCNKDIFEKERMNKHGEVITYIRSSRELTVAEMSLAITRFRNYSASECGFYLPEASEKGALMYAMQQVENSKEYL